jgi:hypothetical protein
MIAASVNMFKFTGMPWVLKWEITYQRRLICAVLSGSVG